MEIYDIIKYEITVKGFPDMKKYTSIELRKSAIVAVLFLAVTLIGLIPAFVNGLALDFLLAFTWLPVLFVGCYFATRSRYLTLDEEKVSFPRGVGNGIRFFQRTTVNFCDVQSLVSELKKGDGFITGDCLWYTMTMKDGTKISFYLYEYGKEAEQEIIETIRSNITPIDTN